MAYEFFLNKSALNAICFAKMCPKVAKGVKKKKQDFIVLVLLSAHPERAGVSCIQIFVVVLSRCEKGKKTNFNDVRL